MDDLISRQTAINALDVQIKQCDKALTAFDVTMKDEYAVKAERASLVAYRETLEYLPSVQSEIIRCEGCIHNGSFDTDCPIKWNGKEYCSFAESEEELNDSKRSS